MPWDALSLRRLTEIVANHVVLARDRQPSKSFILYQLLGEITFHSFQEYLHASRLMKVYLTVGGLDVYYHRFHPDNWSIHRPQVHAEKASPG